MSAKRFAMLFLAVAITILIWSSLSHRVQNQWHDTKPDRDTRSAVADVRPEEVDHIALTFVKPSTEGPGDITVSDKTIIVLLTEGLQEAVVPVYVPGNRISTVTLIMKDGKRLGPFSFAPIREVDAFSPKFVAGLRAAGVKVPWE